MPSGNETPGILVRDAVGLSAWNCPYRVPGPSAIHGSVNSQSQCHACRASEWAMAQAWPISVPNSCPQWLVQEEVTESKQRQPPPTGSNNKVPGEDIQGLPLGSWTIKMRRFWAAGSHLTTVQSPNPTSNFLSREILLLRSWIKSVFCQWQQTDP